MSVDQLTNDTAEIIKLLRTNAPKEIVKASVSSVAPAAGSGDDK